jgi:acyl-CoA thioesterase-1
LPFLLAVFTTAATSHGGEKIEIVTLGDSITRGSRPGVGVHQTFASLLEARLKQAGYDVRVSNVGIGGERTDQALKRLDRDVVDKHPRIVTVMYGTNDGYIDLRKTEVRLPLADYRRNLVEIVSRLRAAGAVPVLMTEPRMGRQMRLNGLGESPNVSLTKYVAACREVAAELDVPLVDHFAHWTKADEAGTDIGAWTTDQCHPNVAGHEQMADLILPVVEKLLKPSIVVK